MYIRRMTPNDALQKAIACFADESGRGGVPGLARAIGYGVTRVDNMMRRRMANPDLPLPATWGLKIELATGGKVKRGQLCPDVPWKDLT